MWIRMIDIPRHETLTPQQKVELIARCIHEYAMARALVMIHGEQRALDRYILAGGSVAYDDDGEPVVWFSDKEEKQA